MVESEVKEYIQYQILHCARSCDINTSYSCGLEDIGKDSARVIEEFRHLSCRDE